MLEAESTPGHIVAGWSKSMKNLKDLFGEIEPAPFGM
jgi:hypothetical protein